MQDPAARLAQITIYPVKSLDGLSVDAATVLASGALAHDRRFALRDSRGEWINAKAEAKVHLLRATFSPDLSAVTLRSVVDGREERFALAAHSVPLEAWLTAFFGRRVLVVEDPRAGFPDDVESPGPTLVSRQSLATVASWFGNRPLDEIERRFRANLLVEADAPFWEDRLVADQAHVVRFQIGDVAFEGVTPCQRCVVPTRDPATAELYPHFARTFADRRRESLPSWTIPERFDHFYRLTVNTRLPAGGQGGRIRVGDAIRIGQTVPA